MAAGPVAFDCPSGFARGGATGGLALTRLGGLLESLGVFATGSFPLSFRRGGGIQRTGSVRTILRVDVWRGDAGRSIHAAIGASRTICQSKNTPRVSCAHSAHT